MLKVGEIDGTRMILNKDPIRPLPAEMTKVETGVGTSSQGLIASCAMDPIGHANVLRERPSVL